MSQHAPLSQFDFRATRSNLSLLIPSVLEQTPSQLRELMKESIQRFNSKQRDVIDKVVHSVLPSISATDFDHDPRHKHPRAQLLFSRGAQSGTGKTFFTTAIQHFLTSRGKRIIEVPSFAIAAELLESGRTEHSELKLSIPVYSESTCSTNSNSQLTEQLKQTVLILSDVMVMTHRPNFEAVDRTIRNLCLSTLPFGGVSNPISWQFWQILPVVRAANRSQNLAACFKRSRLFPLFTSLHLHSNTRLLALQNNPDVTPTAIIFPFYLLCHGYGKFQLNEKNNAALPISD